MRYIILSAIIATVSATNYTPCGNVCANGAAPSDYYTTANGQLFGICPNTDFTGNDLSSGYLVQNVVSAQQLAEVCSTTDGCIAATYNGPNGYLKDGIPKPYGDASDDNNSVFKVICDSSSSTTTTTTDSTTTTTTASMTMTTTTTTTTTSTTTLSTTTSSTTTTTPSTMTTSTTTPSTTTTTLSTSSTTPPTTTTVPTATSTTTTSTTTSSTCPPTSSVVSVGGLSFYQFYSGNGKRNSYSWYRFMSFPASTSDSDAIKNCAAFIAGGRPPFAQTFQVFQYNPDGLWHCDGSLSTNTDSNFTPSSDVKTIYQYNVLPSGCSAPPSTPLPSACPSTPAVSCGGLKFYQLFKGSQVRNSFVYDTTQFYSASTSEADAIQQCANYVNSRGSGVAPVFQVFFFVSDNSWHCDTSKTVNYDTTFYPNSGVKQMNQYVALPSGCPAPSTTTTTTTTAAPTTTTTTTAKTTTTAAPTTTTTTTTRATSTPTPTCPPFNSIVTVGGKSFFTFFTGYAQRNDYSYTQFTTFPGTWSQDQATKSCASFIASKMPGVAQTFQVFYYVDDCKWHCDAAASVNTNKGFNSNSGVKQIAQWNPVPGNCPCKREELPTTLVKVRRE